MARPSNQSSASFFHGARRPFIVRQLLAQIFDGRLKPGTRLVVQRLATEYGMSPTPVREALVELAGIDIVELVPNCGAIVRPFGPTEVGEICHLRVVLEAEAARCACGRVDRTELAALEAELTELIQRRVPDWIERTRAADHRLHELIRARCGNRRLSSEIARYVMLFRTLREIHDARCKQHDDSFRVEENSEHLRIVRSLLAADAEGSAAAMADHIRSAAHNLQQGLFPAPNPDLGPLVPGASLRSDVPESASHPAIRRI